MKQLTFFTSLSRGCIYQKINEGKFPPGFLLFPHIRVWDRATVEDWINQKRGKEA
jgi:predicted DNA-binding transcriptional regulator AlpA|tara:strand:+ start:297 stop:461 length:165 start_codon:yes stop_codon:yes gene_type:complete